MSDTRKDKEREGVLTIGRFLEVDVRISQGAASDDVATDTDGQDAACLVELFKQHCLVHVRVEVSHIERGDGVAGPS